MVEERDSDEDGDEATISDAASAVAAAEGVARPERGEAREARGADRGERVEPRAAAGVRATRKPEPSVLTSQIAVPASPYGRSPHSKTTRDPSAAQRQHGTAVHHVTPAQSRMGQTRAQHTHM